jgi:hypothetical protein
MAEAEGLQRKLLRAQNADGGWGYQNGSSWTEPTALALLALDAQQIQGTAYERGCAWLQKKQDQDGGWSPVPWVDTSTWVTSLALLALSEVNFASSNCQRAVEWTVRQVAPELSPLERLILRMRGMPREEEARGGSPWFPGTAAWIAPTVMSVLALSEIARRTGDEKLENRVNGGKGYILSRRCQDGGWNHGGTRFRSQNAESYPEMTGMALLALRGSPVSDLSISIRRAEAYLSCPGSMEGLSWLQMGLMKHGLDRLSVETKLPCRTIRDICLRLLALAVHSDTNKFLV